MLIAALPDNVTVLMLPSLTAMRGRTPPKRDGLLSAVTRGTKAMRFSPLPSQAASKTLQVPIRVLIVRSITPLASRPN